MEEFDYEKAARVWQRVQNREAPEPLRPDPAALIRDAGELAAMYQALGRLLPGQDGDRLRQLGRECRGCADCLRGLSAIRGGNPGGERGKAVSARQARPLLEGCYHRERKLLEALVRQTADPEWGQVYRCLAEKCGKRCVTVLEVLGRLGR